jgi:hypothetical protein
VKKFSEMAQYATDAELLQTSSNKPNENPWKRNPTHDTNSSRNVMYSPANRFWLRIRGPWHGSAARHVEIWYGLFIAN